MLAGKLHRQDSRMGTTTKTLPCETLNGDGYLRVSAADGLGSSDMDHRAQNVRCLGTGGRRIIAIMVSSSILLATCCAVGLLNRWRHAKVADTDTLTQEFSLSISGGDPDVYRHDFSYAQLLHDAPRSQDFHLTLSEALASGPVRELRQKDFDNGTYIIKQAGVYKLMENIEFAPNKNNGYMPFKDKLPYAFSSGYWLGFFAAIAVTASNVLIDLNGKAILMSREFSLRQRFFSAVELTSKPYRATAGPGVLGYVHDKISSAYGVTICNGVLGRSSHFGIHGLNNYGLWIHNVSIRDFEVGGISLNGASNVHLSDVTVGPSLGATASFKVPTTASFSIAQFMRTTLLNMGISWSSEFTKLQDAVEQFIDGAMIAPASYDRSFLRHSVGRSLGLPDGGSMYGIHFHETPPAVHDFLACASSQKQSWLVPRKVFNFTNVIIRDLSIDTKEVVGMLGTDATPFVGAFGETFRGIEAASHDGGYQGNVLVNATIALQKIKNKDAVAHAALYGSVNLPEKVLVWATGSTKLNDLEQSGVSFQCGRDAMGHVGKGAVGLQLEGVQDVVINGMRIAGLKNFWTPNSSQSQCHSQDSRYRGANVVGISMSNVSRAHGVSVSITDLESLGGSAVGVDAHASDTLVQFHDLSVQRLHGKGRDSAMPYLANPSAEHLSVRQY